ncbi:MAG: BTAD domain-containing putative transcriptional regulator [Gemmatimonadaceae bacterium]
MLTGRHFRLRSLGQLTFSSVVGETETAAAVRPRHLAVLTVLALSSRAVPRDALVEMFWGGETEEKARHSLSNALSGLRSLLGPHAITARRDLVSLAAEARVEVDVLQFAAACEVRDDERAAALYGGPLLAGVYVPDAPEFDAWLSRERAKLERQFLEVCARHVPALIRATCWPEATALATRWVDAVPQSPAAATALLAAHAGPGTSAAITSALKTYDRISQNLAENYGAAIDPSVTAAAAALRDQLSRAEQSLSTDVILAATPTPAASERRSTGTQAAVRTSRRWSFVALAGAALAITIAVWTARRPSAVAAESKLPIVAVTSIDDVRGDSSLDWLRAGLPRMIAADLGGMGGVEVVAPSRVRDVVVRLAGASSAHLSEDQAVDVARRLGAAWAITGGISAAQGGYLLDIAIHNVRVTKPAESFTIMSSNPIELGQLAATRLASLLDAIPGTGAPRYSGIETRSPEAYRHFVRGTLATEAEQPAIAARELDAAIALDSEFVQAIRMRRAVADWLGDDATNRRLAPLEARHESKLPELERLTDEMFDADSLGESSRADAMSVQLIERFPHDPRAYSARADLVSHHGRWAAAESVLVRELALDSLAMVAGDGPCTPCEVLWRLSRMQLSLADRAGAEAAARRWVALQPDLPAAWRNLSATMAAVGRPTEAVDAGLHMIALSKATPAAVDFGRTMLAARRFDIVDSLIAAWRTSNDPVLADGVVDLSLMLARERGQFIKAVGETASLPLTNGLSLVRADALARAGRLGEARAIYEYAGHPRGSSRSGQLTPPEARGFSWGHALEADALMLAGDTTVARAVGDSVSRAAQQSYYGRDKLLPHHVRGMLLFAEGKFADAERELRAAEWSAAAWTRTNVELARAQSAQGHFADAISTLRDARLTALDAMGRYVPLSEIDWWLSRAFASAGQADSARVYAQYVRAAWSHADPSVRARLDSLPR